MSLRYDLGALPHSGKHPHAGNSVFEAFFVRQMCVCVFCEYLCSHTQRREESRYVSKRIVGTSTSDESGVPLSEG